MGSRVTESVRERELLGYDPELLDNITYNDQARPLPNAQLRTSPDPVLTSLAQLGACRTGTSRSLISIFDRKWQYVVAEATPTLSLIPHLSEADRNGQELWQCQTAIPRAHGVSEWTLLYDDPAATSDHDLPVTIISDLTADPRFCDKPYCLAGSPARFYAGAPIRSPRGINVGVYCVIHTDPISERDAKLAGVDVIVRDVTRTIMNHLESRRSAVALNRSENMLRGVASYISNPNTTLVGFQPGNSPTRRHVASTPNPAEEKGPSPAVSGSPRQLDHHEAPLDQPGKSLDVSSSDTCDVVKERSAGEDTQGEKADISSHPRISPPSSVSAAPAPSSTLWSSNDDGMSLGGIFTRAATVIRKSLEIGDVTFFNASSGAFGALVDAPPNPDQSPDPLTTSSSSDEMALHSREQASGFCHVLGTSRSATLDIKAAPSTGTPVVLPASLLFSLLKKHPRGRVFNFDEHGALQSSESSEGSAQSRRSGTPTQKSQNSRSRTRWTRQRQGEALLEIFPGARSISFVPMWDDKKERWYAGGIACTYEHDRVFTPAVELTYLKAFGTLIMAEVHRLEAARSHKAQSDVLGSISHELRSPLHGLILSTELLADTQIDTFQENILHTLETCGRTLLDTVDHLLDYSKVNHLVKSTRKRNARGTHGKSLSIEDGMKSQVSDVRLDAIVEEVVESVFAGFHRMSTQYTMPQDRRRVADPDIGAVMASTSSTGDTKNDSIRSTTQGGDGKMSSTPAGVSVYVDIEPSASYKCRTVAGAIRRVVMNLVGNSLKYTEKGCIEVRLSRDTLATRRRGMKHNMIRIVVADTGKGMSKDFLINDLYKPFAQENQLSAGTGVGLSLVKKLVSSLGGETSVKSQVNVGSEVTVLLPLPPIHDPETTENKEDEVFRAQQQMLKGLRVRLVGFEHTTDDSKPNADDSASVVEKICKGWLGMEVVSGLTDLTSDVIMCVESSLDVALRTQPSVARPPIVVVCPNATTAHSLAGAPTLPHDGQVYEFISQPTGPRKLARVLLLAFHRWLEQQDVSAPPSSKHSTPTPTPSTQPESTTTPATNFSAGWLSPMYTGSSASAHKDSYFPPADVLSKSPQQPKPEPSPPKESPLKASPLKASPPNENPPKESPPKESPPKESPPKESPPKESPPKESPPKKASTLTQAALFPKPLPLQPIVPSSPPLHKPTTSEATEFLLVDDNPVNLRILCAYMTKLGRPFATAVDGVEAVEAFKAHPGRFACILMDINMPRLDGLKATQQIRAHERDIGVKKACSIFALTGLASAEAQREAFESGIGLFLTKPVKLKELSDILRARELI